MLRDQDRRQWVPAAPSTICSEENEALLAAPEEQQGSGPPTLDDGLDDIVISAPASTFIPSLIRVEKFVRSTSIVATPSFAPRPVMTGENIICYPLTPYPSPSRSQPEASTSFPSGSSSIRVVKPDFALSPSHESGSGGDKQVYFTSSTAMYPYQQHGQYGQKVGESSRSGSNATQQQADTRSRVEQLRQQLFELPERGRPRPAQVGSAGQSGDMRAPSTERGRDMHRRYEFIDSDDQPHQVLTPVQEPTNEKDKGKGKAIDTTGRDNDITTVTDLMQQCTDQSPNDQPVHQYGQQQRIDTGAGSSTAQPQSKAKRRPQPLDLQDPAFLGMVSRHTQRYEVQHIPIQSSRAEVFQTRTPYESSSVYSDEDTGGEYVISRLQHKETTERSVNFLEAYSQWREGLNPRRTASQGSIHIRVPTAEEDTFLANREQALRQLSGESGHDVRTDAVVSPPGLARSATMRHAPGQGHDVAGASENTEGKDNEEQGIRKSATMNDVPPRRSSMRLAVPTSPFTPLTPFIMRASGAPANVQGGTKTLFGEKGWLEDTAGASHKKPKAEKTSGFMESLKRMAREFADNSSFHATRHYRSSGSGRLSISLDPREQSLLYGELEFNLNNALDAYIKTQLNGGRLDASKLNRIADGWLQKGRPKVVSFRYDLETQIDLITAHVEDFRFYGPLPARGQPAVVGLLQGMRVNARYMRVRTYCQPDTVIAKQILDSQNLLRLLGSPEFLQRPLEEVAQFFKVAVDRRKIMDAAPPPRDARRPGPDACHVGEQGSHRKVSGCSGQRVHFHGHGDDGYPSHAKPCNVSDDQQPKKDESRVRGKSPVAAPPSKSHGVVQGRFGYRQ